MKCPFCGASDTTVADTRINEDGDIVRRVQLLHQQREIETGGAATYADDFHLGDPVLAR